MEEVKNGNKKVIWRLWHIQEDSYLFKTNYSQHASHCKTYNGTWQQFITKQSESRMLVWLASSKVDEWWAGHKQEDIPLLQNCLGWPPLKLLQHSTAGTQQNKNTESLCSNLLPYNVLCSFNRLFVLVRVGCFVLVLIHLCFINWRRNIQQLRFNN